MMVLVYRIKKNHGEDTAQCGAHIVEGSNFCDECGQELD